MSDIEKFDPTASYHQETGSHYESVALDSLAIHQLLSNEDARRHSDASYGMLDIALSAKGMLATTLGSTLQQELVQNPAEKEVLKGSHDIFALMAEAPFEWKGVTLALGAFALTNAAARVRKYYRMDRDSAKALDQIYAGQNFVPASRRQTMARRAGEKLTRGAVTAAACYGSYKVGENYTAIEDLYGGAGLAATAVATIQVAKYRAMSFSRATMRSTSRYSQNELDY